MIKIKCPRCEGPVWEEDLPDSQKVIDLVCIICGHRKYYPKQKYLAFKRKISEQLATNSRRSLPA
jgi:uncharacterized Zn finger protein (UPF0148 family)